MHERVLLLLVALAASCASPRDRAHRAPERFDASVASLAADLVDAAERRTSLASMRIVIDDLVAVPSNARRFAVVEALEREDAALAATLEHELVLALAGRVHVFATGGALEGGGAIDAALRTRAEALGATHAVLGTFVRTGGELDVTLRLVELETQWVVASVRDRLPYVPPPGYDAAVRPRRVERVAGAEPVDGAPPEPQPTSADEAPVARPEDPPREVAEVPSVALAQAEPAALAPSGGGPVEGAPVEDGPGEQAPIADEAGPVLEPEPPVIPASFDPSAPRPAGPAALRLDALSARSAAPRQSP